MTLKLECVSTMPSRELFNNVNVLFIIIGVGVSQCD